MSTYLVEGDRISLSPLDTRLLVALLARQSGGYELARLCEADLNCSDAVSTGNVYKALARLERMMLVVGKKVVDEKDARRKTAFKITSLGKSILQEKLADYQRLVSLAAERSQNK